MFHQMWIVINNRINRTFKNMLHVKEQTKNKLLFLLTNTGNVTFHFQKMYSVYIYTYICVRICFTMLLVNYYY